ncbi:hypothetical protein POPTR_012G031150v4 [Populus trichocarpa]|uniref:Uncharacterized protein n=1 Tax=Populus trichocarpa TaxID=3694 RepID=A0A3N7FWY1_POPTR|nr:hypothetical protein BDE02_12G008200 [Populus trichocarpa]RQO98220.1 hypothetical protein POPTR_012G031150v4 [Populus trichocarpa]
MRNQAWLEDQFSSLTTHAGPKRPQALFLVV